MAIAAVANWDWPNDWPGLLENIVSSIKQRSDPQLGEFPSLLLSFYPRMLYCPFHHVCAFVHVPWRACVLKQHPQQSSNMKCTLRLLRCS
jgi:hypothetical protein